MSDVHPILDAGVQAAVTAAASRHRGRPWVATGFTDLNDRASHACGILHGQPFSVFAKLGLDGEAAERFAAELRGLTLLRERAGVLTPTPIDSGLVRLDHGCILVTEALAERHAERRTADDWGAIGRTLAALHQVHDARFGLEDFNGFFGPLRQDNEPVRSDRWADFFAERRLLPALHAAVAAGRLPSDLAAAVERLAARLPSRCGPEPRPTLLHGDAQQNNFVSTDAGAVAADVAPYFGHPEIDLALVDYFHPVPDDVLHAYREAAPIDAGFAERRDLWRVPVDLACVTVDAVEFGPRALVRLTETVRRFG
ncbi:MAG TPA: fructosamine kinase family protein [Acidimicrobiales bacterium]|nr:fructosamine kinase family protein [Acidimicrobiales bacterium]